MTSAQQGAREIAIRPAAGADLAAIERLDSLAFPPNDPAREPAIEGELLQGIENGWMLVAVSGEAVVGFLQYDQIGESNIDLISLAVDPAARRGGVGAGLIAEFLRRATAGPARVVSAVTSPQNVDMLRLLLANDFVVARAIRDYFGPGKDRLYCQHGFHLPEYVAEDRVVVPVQAVDYVFSLLEQEQNVIASVVRGAQGDFFEICHLPAEDRAALRANEAAISVGEAGSVVAGFTFVLGLSFVIPDFSDALRVLLLFATILTTGALAIFANSSGNLARVRDNAFDHHMKWANLLLEFGGLYPFAIVLSAVFVHADSERFWLPFGVSLVVSVLLAAYEFSPFSLSRRYRRHWYLKAAMVLTVLLPVAYAPLVLLTGDETLWMIVVGVVLVARGTLQLVRGNSESHSPNDRRRASA